MRLTQFTDYSLRVLMYLAVHEGQVVSMAQIAQAYGISENHLMKIVHLLGRRGFLRTTRGRGGGICLASDPAKIRIGDVVRQTEPDFQLVECFNPDCNTCRIASACILSKALKQAAHAFLDTLDRYTLADLTTTAEPALLRLLKLPSRP